MRVGIQTHYLTKKSSENTVNKAQIAAYFKGASNRIDLNFWPDKLHARNDDTAPADFFVTADPDDYCQHVDAHILAASQQIKMPTIHMFISGGAPKISGTYGDGAILRQDRKAIAVFLGTPNFRTTYANTSANPNRWQTFFLQVCIHEIGHALTLTHNIESGNVPRHIMRQSAQRIVDEYDGAWSNVTYYRRPTLHGQKINCHPLPEKALRIFKFTMKRKLVPGANASPFPEKTHCSC